MDMRFKTKGIIKKVWPTETFTNDFRKRKVVLTDDLGDNSKWPKIWCFVLKQDRCEKADALKEGQRVEVDFVIDGREWKSERGTAYYTDLVALEIEVLSQSGEGSTETKTPPPAEPSQKVTVGVDDTEDDIPF